MRHQIKNKKITVIQHLAALLAICLPTILLYLPYLQNSIVFDDHNLFIGLSIYDYAQKPFSLSPRSLPYFTLGLTQVLFDSIEAHRIISLIFHTLTSWLLYLVIYSLIKEVSNRGNRSYLEDTQILLTSLAVSISFAIHPAAVYGAGYLIQRTIIFATFFSLASLFFFQRGLAKEKISDIALAAIFFGLAVLSKEHSILLPIASLLLILVFKPSKNFSVRAAILYLILCTPSATLTVLKEKSTIGSTYEINAGQIINQIRGISITETSIGAWMVSAVTQTGIALKYLAAWFFPNPENMSADLRIDFSATWTPLWASANVAAFLSIGLVSAFLLTKGRTPLIRLSGFSAGGFWILFLVELATVRFQEPFVLYRSYLWAPFILLLPALGLAYLRPKAIFLIALTILALLFPQAQNRLDSFRNELALWEDAAKKLSYPDIPGADRIYYNRGGEYSKLGRQEEALEELKKVIKLNPNSFQGYLGRGMIRLKQDKPALAEEDFRQALLFRPGEGFILTRLAFALSAQGKEQEGKAVLRQAADAGDSLAQVLLKSSQ